MSVGSPFPLSPFPSSFPILFLSPPLSPLYYCSFIFDRNAFATRCQAVALIEIFGRSSAVWRRRINYLVFNVDITSEWDAVLESLTYKAVIDSSVEISAIIMQGYVEVPPPCVHASLLPTLPLFPLLNPTGLLASIPQSTLTCSSPGTATMNILW